MVVKRTASTCLNTCKVIGNHFQHKVVFVVEKKSRFSMKHVRIVAAECLRPAVRVSNHSTEQRLYNTAIITLQPVAAPGPSNKNNKGHLLVFINIQLYFAKRAAKNTEHTMCKENYVHLQ